MLNEIIEAVGYENILKTIKESQKINNSICIRIPKERKFDKEMDVYINETREKVISKLELQEWFCDRLMFSEKLPIKNKEIDKGGKYASLTTSCQSNAIIFNINTFINKIKKVNKDFSLKESYREDLKYYLLDFIDSYINRFTIDKIVKKWFSATKVEDVVKIKGEFKFDRDYEDELLNNHQLYVNNINYIVDIILSLKKANCMKLMIFIENNLETYEKNYITYFTSKSYSKNSLVDIEGIQSGRNTCFLTLNEKKPFLSHMTKITDEIHLLDKKQNIKISNLNKFMTFKCNNLNVVSYGVGRLEYKVKMLDDGSAMVINSYKNNPYKIIDDLKDNIYIENIISNKKSKEKIITKYSELSSYILQLMDFKIKNYYGDKDRTEGKFKNFSTMYFKYITDLNNSTINTFKSVYKNMIKNMLKLYIYDEEVYKITNIINFDICMNDYLFKSNLKEETSDMMDKIKNKIIKNEKVYIVENDTEFYILCGQLAKYLKSKTKTDKITNRLFYEYNMATKTNRLMDILQRDKEKLDYGNNVNSRSGRILSAINIYYIENKDTIKKIDKIAFNIGLYYGENLLYAKSNKNGNENKKGEN